MDLLLETGLFGLAALALVLGISSILMGVFSPATGSAAMKEKIEYGFFGVSGLVLCVLFAYALNS